MVDLPGLAARFGAACRAAGLPVGPDRVARFARAVVTVDPATTTALRHCARASLVSAPEQLPVLDAVFDAVFGGLVDPAEFRGDTAADPLAAASVPSPSGASGAGAADSGALRSSEGSTDSGTDTPHPVLATAAHRLAHRDFADLTPDELARLAAAMRALRLATPPRRTRRTRRTPHGGRIDLRATLRAARDSGGDPVRLARRAPRTGPRRLVALCDISGSMEPYARALIQLLYCAAGVRGAEVFAFATQLTRLTKALARTSPQVALTRAGALAPDWSGGTRIGECLRAFNDGYGRRGLARGAVVLIASDGWDTGDPALVDREMARLSRVAYRIVWANPRTRHPDYQPLVGGMAAAWPYCDAVVSAHNLAALDDLLAALAT